MSDRKNERAYSIQSIDFAQNGEVEAVYGAYVESLESRYDQGDWSLVSQVENTSDLIITPAMISQSDIQSFDPGT